MTAEEKVAGVTVKKINKELKKNMTKKNLSQKNNRKSKKINKVMDDINNNEYLKMCKEKRGRNETYLNKLVDDIKRVKNTNSPLNERNKKSTSRKKATSPKSTSKPILKTKKTNETQSSPKSKSKHISKKKDSGPRTTKMPRKILSPKKDVPKENKTIKCHHELYISYEQETDRRYCMKGMDLEGVNCSKCHEKFGLRQHPPSLTQPIFVCCNRKSSYCTHSLCRTCFFKLCQASSENGCAKRRSRR